MPGIRGSRAMRFAGWVLAALLVAGVMVRASRGDGAGRGPFDLVTLASLGTVTWACGDAGTFGLGFRPAADAATMRVERRAGDARPVRRTVTGNPLPVALANAARQELRISQPTGAGTLRARIAVDFGAAGVAAPCHAHLPPKVSITSGPRR